MCQFSQSTKIPIRDWNESENDSSGNQTAALNPLKSLSGIETRMYESIDLALDILSIH